MEQPPITTMEQPPITTMEQPPITTMDQQLITTMDQQPIMEQQLSMDKSVGDPIPIAVKPQMVVGSGETGGNGSPLQMSSSSNSLAAYNGDSGSGCSSLISDESSSSPDVQLTEVLPVKGSVTNTTSWITGGDTNEEDRAAFDRVVGDAPQRAHIRLKARHHRAKGDTQVSDGSSDSSSYNRDSPPNILNLSNIDGRNQPHDGNMESEGSSGSGVFFRPSHVAKHLSKHGKARKVDVVQSSDAGIAACTCGSSTSQQSSVSISRESSGQDAGDSGIATRTSHSKSTKSTGHSKRTLATYYQNIQINAGIDAETSNSSTIQIGTIPDTQPDSERDRKRRRFNRTFSALRQCGLLDLTLQTATLMEQSQRMQKQLDTLRKETKVLYSALAQVSQAQPNFLQTSDAQQVMTGLEKIATGTTSAAHQLLNDTQDTTTQLLNDALNLQRDQMLAKGFKELGNEPCNPVIKKSKQMQSASSSNTFTSTSSPTTDSDEIQKQYEELKGHILNQS